MGRALMTTHFDINNFRKTNNSDKQYYRQLHRLDEAGLSTESVEKAVQGSIISLANRDSRAFVIYGEPQSGKTEMMIGATLVRFGLRWFAERMEWFFCQSATTPVSMPSARAATRAER
jgi:hypothetical protein